MARSWQQIHPHAGPLMDKLDHDRTPEALRATIDSMAAPVTKANLEEALSYEQQRVGSNPDAAGLLAGMRDMIDELVAETATNAAKARHCADQLATMPGKSARSIPAVEEFTLSCYTIDGVYAELAAMQPGSATTQASASGMTVYDVGAAALDDLFSIPATPGLESADESTGGSGKSAKDHRPTDTRGGTFRQVRKAMWRDEDDDPNTIGRAYGPHAVKAGAGCAVAIIVALGLAITAFFFLPEHKLWLLVGAGAVIAGGLVVANIVESRTKDRYGPASYGKRAGWVARAARDRDRVVIRRLRSSGRPAVLATRGYPASQAVYDVQRPGGVGHVALTAGYSEVVTANHQRRQVSENGRMYVWVDLPAPLPGLQVVNIRVIPEFATESVDFNARFTIARARVPASLGWDKSELSRYISDVINPRVMSELVDAFVGFPSITIFGDAIGAELPQVHPYRADLTIDVLLKIAPLIPAFAYERYVDQVAREAPYR